MRRMFVAALVFIFVIGTSGPEARSEMGEYDAESLMTPERIGNEDFGRYGIEEKNFNSTCSHAPRGNADRKIHLVPTLRVERRPDAPRPVGSYQGDRNLPRPHLHSSCAQDKKMIWERNPAFPCSREIGPF